MASERKASTEHLQYGEINFSTNYSLVIYKPNSKIPKKEYSILFQLYRSDGKKQFLVNQTNVAIGNPLKRDSSRSSPVQFFSVDFVSPVKGFKLTQSHTEPMPHLVNIYLNNTEYYLVLVSINNERLIVNLKSPPNTPIGHHILCNTGELFLATLTSSGGVFISYANHVSATQLLANPKALYEFSPEMPMLYLKEENKLIRNGNWYDATSYFYLLPNLILESEKNIKDELLKNPHIGVVGVVDIIAGYSTKLSRKIIADQNGYLSKEMMDSPVLLRGPLTPEQKTQIDRCELKNPETQKILIEFKAALMNENLQTVSQIVSQMRLKYRYLNPEELKSTPVSTLGSSMFTTITPALRSDYIKLCELMDLFALNDHQSYPSVISNPKPK